jgi:hypothetical protein
MDTNPKESNPLRSGGIVLTSLYPSANAPYTAKNMPALKNRHILSFAIARRLENPALTRQDVGNVAARSRANERKKGCCGFCKIGVSIAERAESF